MAFFVFPPAAPTLIPVAGGGLFPVRRVFCVAQNYAEHVREMGSDPNRQAPCFFTKPADAVTTAPIVPFPPATRRLDYECELVAAIGAAGAAIAVDKALDHVFAYTVGCDLTRRDLQAEAKKAGRPWDMAKGFDFSAAVGALHPAADIGHPSSGRISLAVNGAERQRGDLSQMIWSVPEIIAALSGYVTLAPGDLLFTGTPAGIGPLAPGDRVDMAIEDVTTHSFTLA
jgi:fumarylpyruvate hydrolase